ncbi:ARF GTPase-activating protein GIT2-like isoform X1 [Lethenteron reissneri]|uniref:ARF GTPase-activating protein GIT2-like isoform X1 n=1 Tax=Lethenteron reissneri TaxID=7753 RepID=UPI002AB7B6BA|nr:ARF GTPase-activating protein GIT2-like isoform X1 [Lethenteron reissneri]
MSRKLRAPDVCADCSTSDPGWASINRGVLVCDECCSVHRSLGRHISQVKHLRHSNWPPSLLQTVQALVTSGANSIWEHSLLDPVQIQSGRRKPNPQDKIHPTKAEYIRAKYQLLAFVHRFSSRDDESVTAEDISKQLHSSVRTGNLETSLRLLSLGAYANFFHTDKGSTPLHVAAKAGQTLQAELLVGYGADPGALDINGKTPVVYARLAGYHELAERLLECQYELTDRLAFYLCGRRPDHRSGQHFIIPQMADRRTPNLDLSELAKAAKKKLQALNNHLFEELAMDVYDEVDRRETDAVWLATQNHSMLLSERTVVPFLPVNSEYSSTRNQGRQKLARFNAREFATLIIDILSDAKRRQQAVTALGPKADVHLTNRNENARPADDQPDYDSVASDEEPDSEQGPHGRGGRSKQNAAFPNDTDGPVAIREFLDVKNALAASEAKVQQLLKVNSFLNEELQHLQHEVRKLHSENAALRQQYNTSVYQNHSAPPAAPPLAPPVDRNDVGPRKVCRPFSMYETGHRAYHPAGDAAAPGEVPAFQSSQPFQNSFSPPRYIGAVPGCMAPAGRGPLANAVSFPSSPNLVSWGQETPHLVVTYQHTWTQASKLDKRLSAAGSDYDNTQNEEEQNNTGSGTSIGTKRVRCDGQAGASPLGDGAGVAQCQELSGEVDPSLPSPEDVIHKTEHITKNIQELLRAAQESKHESKQLERDNLRRFRHSLGCFSSLVLWGDRPMPHQPTLQPHRPSSLDCFVPCSEKISAAVYEMAALFPKRPALEAVRSSLRLLTSSAARLATECRKTAAPSGPGLPPVDLQLLTQQVIQCAYDIAKAARQLVAITTNEGGQ